MTMSLSARWPRYRSPQERRRHRAFVTMASVVIVGVAGGGVAEILASPGPGAQVWGPAHPIVIALPDRPSSYIGAYARGVPASYAPMNSFRMANGVEPNIALYYSGWGEPFKSAFAATAAAHHAVPLVQIDPDNVSVGAIRAGKYDSYLREFAEAVGDFGQRTGRGVIIGFGHEPNGYWYPWSYEHVASSVWKGAWRHIVTLFRRRGADDVTWLWTVNVIDASAGIVSPDQWWPGGKYVTWVGIDGYYDRRSARFASLFGPTIRAIRYLTRAPILVSETGARAKADKPVKIADVFRGVSSYGLLGLVWFDVRAWRLDTPASAAAFASAARNWRLTSG
jgi:mannan endo-1,4-beta-mannosidase